MSQVILVELDALLDTRLGTLLKMGEEHLEKALSSQYRDRVSDRWDEIGLELDQSEYDRLYRERDEDTLRLSRPTGIVPVLTEMTNALGKAAIEDPRITEISLEINVWPYRLSREVKTAIVDSIRVWMAVDCKVSVVDYDLGSVTPDLIDDRYDAVILYAFNDWFTQHGKALLEKRLPTVTMVAPALYVDGKPDEVVEDRGQVVDPFAATELAMVEYLTLVMKDAKFYSLVEL